MSTLTRSATARMNRGRDSGSSDTKSGPAKDMYDSFESWALQNYGDSAKTKTVTRKKYDRIIRILNGEEQSTSENSKFRFWVKAKGFRLGSLHSEDSKERKSEPTLYVPSKQTGGTCLDDEQGEKYKRVAVVEDFFDIIYGVHVEMDGRGGKHAGQKRTYKAIAETYAFLPREAVTRFLMSCSDCQKRMHLTGENNNHETATPAPPEIDFSLPITTTYLNHMRTLGYTKENLLYPEDSVSTPDSDISREDTPPGDESCSPKPPSQNKGNDTDTLYTNNFSQTMKTSASPNSTPYPSMDEPLNMSKSKHNDWPEKETKMEITEDKLKKERGVNDEESVDSSCNGRSSSDITGGAEDLSSGNKDPDDDDEDDVEDKIDDQKHDPERLKAFNMFVRLFVDENLDRMVPISKQPKEKIQAIIESCNRQFPEFQERARKRIRTYLKSCRRMKRSKEHNSWGDTSRPTPPHLTSAMAESILAAACESESKNAKRMRMGMDPLPTVSQPPSESPTTERAPSRASSENHVSRPSPHLVPSNDHSSVLTNGNVRSSLSSLTACGRGQSSVIQRSSPLVSAALNGPTDLSIKKSQPKCQLNPSEVAAVKQLIAGYRESAAFLYRSADELEQLLVQQN